MRDYAILLSSARQTIWRQIRAVCALVFLLSGGVAYSDESVILTLVYTEAESGLEMEKTFSRHDLRRLPQQTIVTKTPWTDATPTFTGPLIRDVLQDHNFKGNVLFCTALNDYTIEIPLVDVTGYDVILAMDKDGEAMGVRDKGPLWVIYPWGKHPSLWTESVFGKSIWQLHSIEIR